MIVVISDRLHEIFTRLFVVEQFAQLPVLHPLRAKLGDEFVDPAHGFFFPSILRCTTFTFSR